MLDKAATVRFSGPRQYGDASIEHCIRLRRSVRDFRNGALKEEQLGQLLWAAQGITSIDGRRAAPSAGALYPLALYADCADVAGVASGVYRYDPAQHELTRVASGCHRDNLIDATGGQEWIGGAAAVICIGAVFERTTAKYGARGRGYVYLEAGHAAENLMLQAVALGLATTMVGAFVDEAVKRLLHLPPNATPLCLIAVGTP